MTNNFVPQTMGTDYSGKYLKVDDDGNIDFVPAPTVSADRSLGLTSATVGQLAKITAVDADGKPTAWEPVDMPSGGGNEEWELIASVVIPDGAEEANALTISVGDDGLPFSLEKARLQGIFPPYNGDSELPKFSFAMLNGKTTGRITPLIYTGIVRDYKTSASFGFVWGIDFPGCQRETLQRSGNPSWSNPLDLSTEYVYYGTTSDSYSEFFGETMWAYPITSIGMTNALIYPGCRFMLYGVRKK